MEAYHHETKPEKNAVHVRLASYDTQSPTLKDANYYPQLDPQLTEKTLKEFINGDKFELLTNTSSTPFIRKREMDRS